MRNTLITSLFVLSLCSVSLSQEQTKPNKVAPPVGAVAPQGMAAQLALDTKKAQYSGNEDVFLNITLQNTGTTVLKSSTEDVEVFYHIEVTDSTGRKVPFLPAYDKTRIGGGEPWGVAPDHKSRGYVHLNRIFDLSRVDKYAVTVSKKIDQGQSTFTVTSQPLPFEITSVPTLSGWQ